MNKINPFNTSLLIVLALAVVFACRGSDVKWQPCQVQQDGHTLQIGFKTDISTNDPGYFARAKDKDWRNFLFATNRMIGFSSGWYRPEPELPFPRTNSNQQHFEVYSNTYALAMCDGNTNQLSENHVKLGDYFKTDSTVISTVTNTVSTESFTPVSK